MTSLRSRCEALVRELSGPNIEASDRLADYCAGQDDVIKRLQAALDAQRSSDLEDDRLRADDGRDAARYRWLLVNCDIQFPRGVAFPSNDNYYMGGFHTKEELDPAIDAAMKESKP